MPRPIIDEVVTDNRFRNQQVYYEVLDMPMYVGDVRDANKDVIKLGSPSKGVSKLGILEILKTGIESFALEPGEGQIISVKTVDGKQVTKAVNVDPCIVKLIKVAVVASYSQNDDYSLVISEFARQLLETCENINLPLHLPRNNKAQQVLSDELNEFVEDYLTKNNIKFYTEVSGKSSYNKLLQAAEASDVQ